MKGGGTMLFNYKDINSLTVVVINSKEVGNATARQIRIYNSIASLLSAYLENFVNYYIYNSTNITSKFIVPIADCLKFIPADTTMSIPLLYLYKMILQLRITTQLEIGAIYDKGHHNFISKMNRSISYYHNDVLDYIYKNPSILGDPTLLDIARNIFPADFINSIKAPLRWSPVPAKRELRLTEPIKKPIKIDNQAWHEWNPLEPWKYETDDNGNTISNKDAKPKIGFTMDRQKLEKIKTTFILPKIDYDLLQKAVIFLLDFPLIGKFTERMECRAYHGIYHYGHYIKKYGFSRILDIKMSKEIQLEDLLYYDKQYNILIGSKDMLVITESPEFQNKKGNYLPGKLERLPRDGRFGLHTITLFNLAQAQSPAQEEEIRDEYNMSGMYLKEELPPFYSSIDAYKLSSAYKLSPEYKEPTKLQVDNKKNILTITIGEENYVYNISTPGIPSHVWFNRRLMKYCTIKNGYFFKKLIEYLKDKHDLNTNFIEYTSEMETKMKTEMKTLTDKTEISTIDLDNLLISNPSIVLPILPEMSTKQQQVVEQEQLKAQEQLETERLNAEKEAQKKLMAPQLKKQQELREQQLKERQLKAQHKTPVNRIQFSRLSQSFEPSLETRQPLQLVPRRPILPEMSSKQRQLNAFRNTPYFPRTLSRTLHRNQQSRGGYTRKTIKNTRNKNTRNKNTRNKNTRKTIKNTSRRQTYKSTELKSRLV
jgi:hypothetical protein